MEDGIGLFKVLVVLLLVGFQLVQTLRKKARRQAPSDESADREEPVESSDEAWDDGDPSP